jgi:hypothetical protein
MQSSRPRPSEPEIHVSDLCEHQVRVEFIIGDTRSCVYTLRSFGSGNSGHT